MPRHNAGLTGRLPARIGVRFSMLLALRQTSEALFLPGMAIWYLSWRSSFMPFAVWQRAPKV